MTIEEILAGLARECRTALRLAKRYAELDRQQPRAASTASRRPCSTPTANTATPSCAPTA